jgi:hypothetical protein
MADVFPMDVVVKMTFEKRCTECEQPEVKYVRGGVAVSDYYRVVGIGAATTEFELDNGKMLYLWLPESLTEGEAKRLAELGKALSSQEVAKSSQASSKSSQAPYIEVT